MSELSAVLPSISTQSESSIRTDYNYTIETSRFGLAVAVFTDGTRAVTGLTEEAVRTVMDTIHIPVLKGTFDGYTSMPRSSVVAGKL